MMASVRILSSSGAQVSSLLRWQCYVAARSDLCRASYSTAATPPKEVAFAFDIDGVLKAGNDALPMAQRALHMLHGNNPLKKKIPYVFITNGGGYSESRRANNLSRDFAIEVSPQQVILAHTVFSAIPDDIKNQNVLMVGGPEGKDDAARETMYSYGFKNVYTVPDVMKWNPSAWPFLDPTGLSKPNPSLDFFQIPFSAVLVFHDSRDWGRDIQIICDVLRSPTGTIGQLGNDTHPQPFLAFSHKDLLWGTDFPTPRFGQGAFQLALRSVYEETSGRKLESVTFGKPQKLTYEFADRRLQEQALRLDPKKAAGELDVWMIGDNPASDIAGANAFGWKSALVNTGVYRKENGPPAHTPTLITHNVEEAVRTILSDAWSMHV